MSKDKTCPNCGAALMPGDVFCGECGARVQKDVYGTVDIPAPPQVEQEPLADEQVLTPNSAAGKYIPPPPAKDEKASDNTTLKVIIIVAAVVFLLVSLCLCSLGGLILIPTQETGTIEEDNRASAVVCCVPGVISGLLGVGAAYFALRKR